VIDTDFAQKGSPSRLSLPRSNPTESSVLHISFIVNAPPIDVETTEVLSDSQFVTAFPTMTSNVVLTKLS
jgi:hypothetical protein